MSGSLFDAALVGAATGLRSTIGVGALVETASRGLPAFATTSPARVVGGGGVAGGLAVAKRPKTASRLEPPGLPARIVLAAVAGAALARASERPMVPAALLASTT